MRIETVAMAGALLLLAAPHPEASRPALPLVAVEPQPLAAQASRVAEALAYIGAPLATDDRRALDEAAARADGAAAIQAVLDRYCLLDVHINPESRVKVMQGPARAELLEQGWRTFLVKVRNEAGVTAPLRVTSPNAERVFSRGPQGFSISPRPVQTVTARDVSDRWLDLYTFDKQPLTPALSGLELEYRILQLYSRDPGRREATLAADVGQGSQDIGFRNDAPVLFTVHPSVDVTLRVADEHGKPTTAGFVIRDAQKRVYPSQTKRLAPDFAFHPQVYRSDGETVRLAEGTYDVEVTRGPEYVAQRQQIRVSRDPSTASFKLERWIDLPSRGWFSGDHHVHAAGCLHYESPSEGVEPRDMIRHILGEALNVGSVLTWGPAYYYQKQFFEGRDHKLSTRDNLMRYDVEVSGFPSSHAGHLVLLRLKEQDYPGAKVLEEWPTWTLPILKWARAQGAVVGFAHSGWGLEVSDTKFPTRELPKFDGIGANEYIVDVAHDAVDFISTVDTPAHWELNMWYHTLNVGFRTRISGETDFPCIFGDRVGLGRSYVKLDRLDYDAWAQGIREGRAYVTDGKSHLIDFKVNDRLVGTAGSEVRLARPGTVRVTASVAARLADQPELTPTDVEPRPRSPQAPREVRTLPLHEKPYWHLERARQGATREVPLEVIVNGRSVARKTMVADGTARDVVFDVPIGQSSWVALRILPSSHTNPIFVVVDGKPVRASRESADWCLRAVDQCWSQKVTRISERERPDAERAYEHARTVYRRILTETPAGQ
jgi:hypothetical protein